MAIQVFGAGVGRTGTFSLKLAINRIERNPENWANSFGATIYKLLAGRDQGPPEMKAWLDMADEPFPRTNDRAEFWDRVTGKI